MLAALPLRALAAVTIGFCAIHHASNAAESGHDHAGTSHGDRQHDECNACVEHCASASFFAPAELPLPTAARANAIGRPERFAVGFVADPLDPPPLAS
jgi:hypothetical protein